MRALTLAAISVAIAVCFSPPGFAQQTAGEPIYRFDPALIVESPRQTTLSADPQGGVIIEKDKDETRVQMHADSTISPYLDATRGPELSPEELRLLPESSEVKGVSDYALEAGLGLYVKDRARLNLGYRLQSQPSLLDDQHNGSFSLTGDLRVTFDVKVPFD